MLKAHPIIDKHIDMIREKAKTESSNAVRKELGINCATWYRYIAFYNIQFVDMKQSLSCSWTPKMLLSLKLRYSKSFNAELAKELRVSMRTLIRKARALGLQKEEGFLNKHRAEITRMAQIARPKNDAATIARITEAGKPYRFKAGQTPHKMDYKKIWDKRRANAQAIQEAIKNPY